MKREAGNKKFVVMKILTRQESKQNFITYCEFCVVLEAPTKLYTLLFNETDSV